MFTKGTGRVAAWHYGGRLLPAAAILTGLLAAADGVASEAESLADALADGNSSLNLRYRYEHVDQDGFAEDANASTLRLRLNYASGSYRGWSGLVEFDYVTEVLLDDFNHAGGVGPDRARYPVVADPHGGDLNQLYVDYSGMDRLLIRLGRQRILLDNQRFVGGVGWRQNEQTYDGVMLKVAATDSVDVQYAFVSRVNRIFGDRAAGGRHDTATHLLNTGFRLGEHWSATAYGYYIDNDDAPAFSTMTVGARLQGSVPLGQRRLQLLAETARQQDAANAPVDYSAGYLRLDAELPLSDALRFKLGFERLEGDADEAGKAFRTPLATLHAFQGWADQFLATPAAGIEDSYAGISVKAGNWTLSGTWHDFSAESGSADWGSEIDLSASRKLGERYRLLLKAAAFDAEDGAYQDVQKFWLMLTAGF